MKELDDLTYAQKLRDDERREKEDDNRKTIQRK